MWIINKQHRTGEMAQQLKLLADLANKWAQLPWGLTTIYYSQLRSSEVVSDKAQMWYMSMYTGKILIFI